MEKYDQLEDLEPNADLHVRKGNKTWVVLVRAIYVSQFSFAARRDYNLCTSS